MHNAVAVLALVLSPVIGLITPYLLVWLALATWIRALVTGTILACYQDFVSRAFLAAFILLSVAFIVTRTDLWDTVYIFNFIMFLLYGPLAVLIRRGSVGRAAVQRLASYALAGTALAFAMVAWQAATGAPRPAGINIGPIVLSNAALALGFVSLIGAISNTSRANLVFFLGPILAIATVLLTKSRGPLLGIPFLLTVTCTFLWFGRFRRVRLVAVIAAVGLGVAGIAALLLLGGRSMTVFSVLNEFFTGERIADHSSRVRLTLYESALRAFADSPVFGHGWAHLMSSMSSYIPKSYRKSLLLPQIHNDILNFSVSGGVLGITAYVLIIIAPIATAIRAPRNAFWLMRLYGVTVLSLVYLSAGFTDLMFGHEFHSALYVTLSAVILGIGWPDRIAPPVVNPKEAPTPLP